jgi:hypothetical protein
MISPEAVIGLAAALIVPFIGALITVGIMIGSVRAMARELSTAVADWKKDREKLDKVPLTEQRVDQLEDVVAILSTKQETIWTKVFSHDKHLAVAEARRSRPSFDEGE